MGLPSPRQSLLGFRETYQPFQEKYQIEFIYLLWGVAIQGNADESDFSICNIPRTNEKRNIAGMPGIR
jgi:hypothetical protein